MSSRMQRHYRLWLLGGLVALCIILMASPVRQLLDHQALMSYLAMLERSQAVLLFLIAHLVATVLGIPGTVLVIAGGAVFGLVWGTFLSVIGATLGAIAAFLVSRYLFHDWFTRRFRHSPHFKRMNQTMCRNALTCVLVIRFAPVSPFNIVNFLLGLTPLPLRPYAVGTLIGIIPGTLVYTWMGVTGLEALEGNWFPFAIASICLVLLSVLPIFARRYMAQRNREEF